MGNFFKNLFSSSKNEEPDTEVKSKTDQKNFDILKYDGIRAQRIGQINYAIKCFTEALNIEKDFETMNYLVGAYVSSGKLEEALDITNEMIELEPENASVYLSRANILFMLEREPETITDCNKVLELDKEQVNPLACFLMSKAKKNTNDLFGAVADVTTAIAHNPEFTEAYLLRAELLMTMEHPKDALADIEKAIQLTPDEETNYILRGKIHEAMGDTEAATNDYKKIMELNPFNQDAYLLLGSLLITQQKPDEAILCFDEALEINPEFAKAYSERGKAKNLKGDKEGAIKDLKKAIELNPEGEEAQLMESRHTNFDNMYKGGIF